MATASPNFAQTANNGYCTILPALTANVKSDGAGTVATDLLLLYTAASTHTLLNPYIVVQPVASAASTTLSATTIRAFRSTVASSTTTNANTFNIGEVSIGAIAVDVSGTAIAPFIIPIMCPTLKSGDFIYVSTHVVAAASTAFQCRLHGLDFA